MGREHKNLIGKSHASFTRFSASALFLHRIHRSTNVNHADGISRHRLTPHNVHSPKYNSRSHDTRFPVPVQSHVRFKVIKRSATTQKDCSNSIAISS